MHHIKPTTLGGTHDESNLCVLCAGCHKRIETMTIRLFRLLNDLDMAVEFSREIIAAVILKGDRRLVGEGIGRDEVAAAQRDLVETGIGFTPKLSL